MSPILSAAERKELKARAHHLKPVVMIGESGLTDAVLAETERALAVHALIKLRVFGDDRDARRAIMQRLCETLGCAPVQMIGKLLVIWRPLPPEEPTGTRNGPHVPKKAAATGATRAPARRKPARPGAASDGGNAGRSASTRGGVANRNTGKSGGTADRRTGSGGVADRRTGPGSASADRRSGTGGPAADRRSGTGAGTSRRSATGGSAPKPGAGAGARGGTGAARASSKPVVSRTAGKRTDLADAGRPTTRKPRASKATQGPSALQGRAGPRTGGPRARATKKR